MIFDTTDRLGQYLGISENLDTAIRALQALPLSPELPDGKVEVDGDKVFYTVSTTALRPYEQTGYEQHRIYADIQLLLSDGESMEYLPGGKLSWQWAENADFARGTTQEKGALFAVPAMHFAIFFPGEGHRPCIGEGTVRKLVVKVKF